MESFKQALNGAIARIYYQDSETVVGVGFLVSDRHLLTCAHVVATALGISERTVDPPTATLTLDFPLVAPGQKPKPTARVVFWRPVRSDNPEKADPDEDIAGLQLEQPLRPPYQSVHLVTLPNFSQSTFQTFGFPSKHEAGIWVTGKVMGRRGNGWVQVQGGTADVPIQKGFSGAPVWDEQEQAVVGMMVAVDKQFTEAKVAYMIPAGTLKSVWPTFQDPARAYGDMETAWKEHLSEIDFTKSKQTIAKVLDSFKKPSADQQALFLLQKSNTQKGDLLTQHLEAGLKKLGTWYAPYRYECPTRTIANPQDFLSDISYKFSLHPSPSSSLGCCQQLVQQISNTLYGGNVFLLQITLHFLDEGNNFLDWFVQEFWCPLIDHLEQRRQQQPFIRIVGIIAIHDKVPQTCLTPALCCEKKKLNGRKLLELPLQNWTQTDLQNWLWQYSGLSQRGYNQTDLQTMATTIHRTSEKGIPHLAHSQLMKALQESV